MEQKSQRLTEHQLHIALLACEGYSTKDIALLLGREYTTVHTQINRIMRVLGIPARYAIPRKLIENGYLDANKLPKPIDRHPMASTRHL